MYFNWNTLVQKMVFWNTCFNTKKKNQKWFIWRVLNFWSMVPKVVQRVSFSLCAKGHAPFDTNQISFKH